MFIYAHKTYLFHLVTDFLFNTLSVEILMQIYCIDKWIIEGKG